MGVIFFVMNAAFALVLLILVLISSIYALISKNPDVRYQPMRDDRASFIKSNSQMIGSTELDALGVTARGDMKSRDLEDDDSYSAKSSKLHDAAQVPLPPSTAGSYAPSYNAPSYNAPSYNAPSHHRIDSPPSPVSPAVPMFPTSNNDPSRNMYNNSMAQQSQSNQLPLLTTSGIPRSPSRGGAPSPSPSSRSPGGYDYNGQPIQRSNTGGSMNWHTGAGYDR
jgi:Transient receptor potential (TRP) ion channel